MSKFFYRFRKTQNIFDFKELESQKIYFASNEELNDPMEGFKNLVFKGDKIVWRNLFRHYLLCLEFMYQTYLICGEEYSKYDTDFIPIFRTVNDLETPKYKELFKKIYLETFEVYGELIDKIATRRTSVSREELAQYLKPYNMFALEIIQKNYELEGLIPQRDNKIEIQKLGIENNIKYIEAIETVIQEHGHEKMDSFFKLSELQYNDFVLHLMVNANNKPNWLFIVNFTQNYLQAIEKLTYPKTYVACFTGEKAINNSSVWGHYGDSHKGVCLIFESNENKRLSLSNAKIGYGGGSVILGKIDLSFEKITYGESYPEIDFFCSLGRLPIPKLETWLYNYEEKQKSNIHNEIFNDENNWRKKYWDNFAHNNLVKTEDWKYEDEYRLVLNGGMDGEIDKQYRLLQYDFKNLKGLVFGINTLDNEKVEIFKIIQKKCIEYQRKDFELYQAYYCSFNKNIQFKKLNIPLMKTVNPKKVSLTND